MTATVRLDGDELIASRTIAATLDDVWGAFTRPEHLAGFWGGDHATVVPGSVTVDLRRGGSFELDTEAGGTARLRFVYDEVHAPTLLVFTEHAHGIVTTVQLDADPAGTTVIVHQRRLPPELRTSSSRCSALSPRSSWARARFPPATTWAFPGRRSPTALVVALDEPLWKRPPRGTTERRLGAQRQFCYAYRTAVGERALVFGDDVGRRDQW